MVPRSTACAKPEHRESSLPGAAATAGSQPLPRQRHQQVLKRSQPIWRPGGTSRAPLAPGLCCRTDSDGVIQCLGLCSSLNVPARTAPDRGTEDAPVQRHMLQSLCPSPLCCARVDRAPEGSPYLQLPGATSAPPHLPAPHLQRPHGRTGEGLGCLPLGCKVPRRLPPSVAVGWGPWQQEHDTGGPEEQSGPHDRQRCVPPARLGSGAAHGGGGYWPSPLLLAPRGANQRAPSWHADPSRGAGDAERRGWGPARGRCTRLGGGVSGTSEGNTQKAVDSCLLVASRVGSAEPRAGSKIRDPLRAGFSPWPPPPARVWESAS